MRIDARKPIRILTVRFKDMNDYVWIWDLENEWVDVEYGPDEDRPLDSGYPAGTWAEVMQIMFDGGFI